VSVPRKPVGPATLPSAAVPGPAIHLPVGDKPTSPLVYGYVRVGPSALADAPDHLARELARYAAVRGLLLADVFVDEYANSAERTAFVVMVESLRRPDVYGVLVPSLDHFSRFSGMRRAMCALIEFETGAHVLVMDKPTEGHYDTATDRTTETAERRSSAALYPLGDE
jgi:hypothetical protein